MDYSSKTLTELKAACKERSIKGFSGKSKADLVKLLSPQDAGAFATPTTPVVLEKERPYLEAYLQTIKSPGGFKRVSLSPLRYAGGKSNAIGLIFNSLPALKEKKIVSPFFGGGSFELAAASIGFEVIGYDVFGVLVNFWNQILTNPEALADKLATFVADKEHYTRNRHILLAYWEKVKPPSLNYVTRNPLELTDEEKVMLDNDAIAQAAYYYYNMQLSYGPMFLGWPSSVYLKEDKYTDIVQRVRDFNPGNVKVLESSFDKVIPAHKNDFLFLDPPYYLGEDSKMFKGMYPNCNFAIHHNGFDHKLMCEQLKNHSGGFLITYNDCPTIREWYKEYEQIFPKWHYTYGQGETRVGKNRNAGVEAGEVDKEKQNVKQSHEIFIICPPRQTM